MFCVPVLINIRREQQNNKIDLLLIHTTIIIFLLDSNQIRFAVNKRPIRQDQCSS